MLKSLFSWSIGYSIWDKQCYLYCPSCRTMYMKNFPQLMFACISFRVIQWASVLSRDHLIRNTKEFRRLNQRPFPYIEDSWKLVNFASWPKRVIKGNIRMESYVLSRIVYKYSVSLGKSNTMIGISNLHYILCNEGLIGRLLFLKRTIVYKGHVHTRNHLF